MLSPKLKNFSILIACTLLVTGMSSCRKNEMAGPGYINIRGGVSTRTFFGSTNFNDTSNRAKILDFITLPGQNENSTPYIDDELYSHKIGHEVEDIASDWTWSLSGTTYFWTNTGSHRFISWLTYDAALDLTTNSFFGSAPVLDTPTHKVLSIPSKTFNADTPQFDFIYSDASVRSMDDEFKNYSSVLLAYKHLFTAFSIGIRNWTPTPVVIKSFQLKNMQNSILIRTFKGIEKDVNTAYCVFVIDAFSSHSSRLHRRLCHIDTTEFHIPFFIEFAGIEAFIPFAAINQH
jgi:hypothetical protein